MSLLALNRTRERVRPREGLSVLVQLDSELGGCPHFRDHGKEASARSWARHPVFVPSGHVQRDLRPSSARQATVARPSR